MDREFLITIAVAVSAILVSALVTLYVHLRRPKKKQIVIVDDDLGTDDKFLDILRTRFHKYDIRAFSRADAAIEHLRGRRDVALCLVDLIFRSESSMSGIALMEQCLKEHIRVLIMTGHAIEELGLQVRELAKMGVKKSKIMRKPATIMGYEAFLNKIEEALT
jgi:FixJ family two-component response regulator